MLTTKKRFPQSQAKVFLLGQHGFLIPIPNITLAFLVSGLVDLSHRWKPLEAAGY